MDPEDNQGVNKEEDMKEEQAEVEMGWLEEAKEESQGGGDMVVVAEGVPQFRVSEWLAGVMGGQGRQVVYPNGPST